MQLSEKEIGNILAQVAVGYFSKMPLFPRPADVRLAVFDYTRKAARDIAQAEAEKMRGVVVWECVGTLSYLNHVSERMSYSTELGDGDFWWAIFHGIVGEEGKQYRVTLTEEKNGQEVRQAQDQ